MVSVVLIAMYTRIFRIAYVQMKNIREQEKVTVGGGHLSNNKADKRQQELKLLKTGFIVFASFYACWLPYFMITAVQVYKQDFHSETVVAIRLVTIFLFSINSALNPIIYTYRLPAVRVEVKCLFNMKVAPHEHSSWVEPSTK